MKPKTTVTKGVITQRRWHLIDLKDQNLGRSCTKIAQLLIGKDNINFSYNRDDGDYVLAINAKHIKVTGKKLKEKIYYRHSAWSGHLKSLRLEELMEKDCRKVIMLGVKNMLPKNKLRNHRLKRLKVFPTSEHNYSDKIKNNDKK
jgi:large subunit ribosomal protein L13